MDAGALKPHRAVIEAGPAGIRRLCCVAPGLEVVTARTVVDAIDDAVVLVDDTPVSTVLLWQTVLRSLCDDPHTSLAIVHPSWWSTARVALVRCAAGEVTSDAVIRRRSKLLARAATVVVEIAERFVVITGAQVVAERRDSAAYVVAENVTRVVTLMTARTVVIDAPGAISGAAELAKFVADRLREADAGVAVTVVDDAAFSGAAVEAFSADDQPVQAGRPAAADRGRTTPLLLIAAVILAAALLGVGAVDRRAAPPTAMPTTFLVEGRVALTVPAQWSAQRVVAGPGSARVQITSPTDPETALHVTQSPVVDETLSETAETLKRAIDEAPAGVFIDFNPNGRSSGRPAVTYREVRTGHEVRWAVLLDGVVRISIGCQSRPGNEVAVRDACELAVRSAHALK